MSKIKHLFPYLGAATAPKRWIGLGPQKCYPVDIHCFAEEITRDTIIFLAVVQLLLQVMLTDAVLLG